MTTRATIVRSPITLQPTTTQTMKQIPITIPSPATKEEIIDKEIYGQKSEKSAAVRSAVSKIAISVSNGDEKIVMTPSKYPFPPIQYKKACRRSLVPSNKVGKYYTPFSTGDDEGGGQNIYSRCLYRTRTM